MTGPLQALDGWALRPASPDMGAQRPLPHGTPRPMEPATDQHPLGEGTSATGEGPRHRGEGLWAGPTEKVARRDQPSWRGSPPGGAPHPCAWGPGTWPAQWAHRKPRLSPNDDFLYLTCAEVWGPRTRVQG